MTQCIIYEKELLPVREGHEANEQYLGAGEIKMVFDYGSRYDWMGYTEPVHEGPVRTVKVGDFEVEIQDVVDRKPTEDTLKSEDRAKQLSGCNRISAQLCDDCFAAKAHLFRGYQDRERIV